jgi:hypothetical protein
MARVSWFLVLRSMGVVVFAPRATAQKRPVNRTPRSPVGRWSSAAPVEFLAADRVPEKCSRAKREK